ncbi:MAG: hypothetical protein EXR50_06165 [Dehalococcoidia bacterium]|nr:hypothetical protein [Dehalococcoidia bacterium]
MGAELDKLIKELEDVRRESAKVLANLSDEQLDLKNERGRSVRAFIQALADHDNEHVQHLIGARRGVGSRRKEVNRLLGEMMAARGQLLGLIAGLEDDNLDKDWKEGEWSIRNILEHMVQTERTYIMDNVQKLAGGTGASAG